MRKVCLFAVRAYQVWLGPLLGGTCRFYPSCSHYAYEAIERHGAARGAWLALRRLLRCQPFSPGGLDPVPLELPRYRAPKEKNLHTPSGIAPRATSMGETAS
jgi:putative membrane protein insertion efficiency factor